MLEYEFIQYSHPLTRRQAKGITIRLIMELYRSMTVKT